MDRKTSAISGAALGAILDEIEHNCDMLVLSDEETAADDVGFYVPRIRRALYELRQLIRSAGNNK